MEQADRELGASFGAAAVAYAEHRPDYALAAVEWALEPAPGRRVLDLGAGTGKLTATLLARAALRRYPSQTGASMLCWPATPCTGSTWTSRDPRSLGS